MASGSGRVLADSKSLVELFTRLQENLGKATDKNESLLEAIESSEARASSTSGEVRSGMGGASCVWLCSNIVDDTPPSFVERWRQMGGSQDSPYTASITSAE